MCQGFGLIVSKDLKVYFIEPNYSGDCSHSDILERLGWKENDNKFLRNFVRVEYPDWTADSFRFDEENTLPGWVENSRDDIRTICDGRVRRCAPAWAEYKKVCAPAWAEYNKVCATAWAEYKKVEAPAWVEYKKVCAPAWAEYNKVCAPARAEMIAALSKIEGYVPERE